MFTDKEITVYRNIKAPDDLCHRITKSQSKQKKVIYFSSAIAVCFIFIISAFVINNQSNIVINGQNLNDSIVFYDTSATAGRSISSEISIPIEIKAKHDTKVVVSNGLISIEGSNPSSEILLSDSQQIWWHIDPNATDTPFEMYVSDKKGVEKVTLKYENTKITVTKEKSK